MKKYILFYLLFSFLNINALDTKLALELARSKNIGMTIERANTIYEYINLFVMETGYVPMARTTAPVKSNMQVLEEKYGTMNKQGYDKNQLLSFSFSPTPGSLPITTTTVLPLSVVFKNIVPNNLSNISKQVYRNNPNIHQNAIINPDNSMSIKLKPETIKFLINHKIVKTLAPTSGSGLVSIQDEAPTCNSTLNHGSVWYRPDVSGGYLIYFCATSNTWEQVSNKPNIEIYRTSKVLLDTIKPPKGTKGYALNGTQIWEYIYNGSSWIRVVD